MYFTNTTAATGLRNDLVHASGIAVVPSDGP